ncbi:MAG: hypothetical protein ABUL65_02940 [Opitutus sp.]
MKTKLIPVLILAAGLLGTASAAEPETAASPAAPALAPDRTIFSPRLPSPAELTEIAAAQGQTIERIEQTASQVTITTKTAEGRTTTVLYQLLSTAGNAPAARVATTAPRATVTSVVVQDDDPDVVYVPRYRYYGGYDPVWDYWPPLALGIGLGWTFHGGYYGHGHYGWHHR